MKMTHVTSVSRELIRSTNESARNNFALELLRTRGIRSEYWKTWEKTTEMLPSTGQKQYEPNNSWLQNKQIEKGLNGRETLLAIERVERGSQLAAAEWLPQESRARVTKRSGQDWTSFGLEENLELYLMPEEALLLLELNCLELSWQGVTLSIQQAYDVLLKSDQAKSTKDEYRVYSHLVRQGYRLQRFRYGGGPRQDRPIIQPRRSSVPKRKAQIHDPLNAFGITKDGIHTDDDGSFVKDPSTLRKGIRNKFVNSCWETGNNPNSKPTACGEVVDEKFIDSDCQPTRQPGNKLPSELYDNGVVNLPGPSSIEAKKSPKNTDKNSMLPTVISDEIFLGELNIIANWPGVRIQKNTREQNAEQNHHLTGKIQDTATRHALGMTESIENSSGQKRTMHEIIELSDEEIEEIPRKMSRMEMLNLFPNVISQVFVPKKISKRYLPDHIWPQNVSNRYMRRKVLNQEKLQNDSMCNIPDSDLSLHPTKDAMCPMQMDQHLDYNSCTDILSPRLGQRPRNAAGTQPNTYRNIASRHKSSSIAGLYENVVNCTNVISQQGSCFRTDFFGHQSRHEKSLFQRGGLCRPQKHWMNKSDRHLGHDRRKSTEINESSFKIVPGALSWVETKSKWIDERTITIEDEDGPIREDSMVDENEVKVLTLPVNPLVGTQNVMSFAQVYQHLQIIKEATSKDMKGLRRQEQATYCKLSYNLYSTAQRFKKAHPGSPMYRIAVLRSEENPVIESVDMVGLLRDAKETPVVLAWVSPTSITFAELGRIRIPDGSDIPGQRQLNHSL